AAREDPLHQSNTPPNDHFDACCMRSFSNQTKRQASKPFSLVAKHKQQFFPVQSRQEAVVIIVEELDGCVVDSPQIHHHHHLHHREIGTTFDRMRAQDVHARGKEISHSLTHHKYT
ncbi:unnamed protein product, partial [Ectocarpus sp. 12 AP-2014]